MGSPKPLIGNQVRHILIILSILLFSSFLISCKENIQGPFTLPDGLEYVEGSKNIKKNGQGSWSYYDGRTYEGEFKDGKFNGQGTMTLKNGKKYVGEYKDGYPNGQGTETYPDGGKYVGEFKDGETWEGTEYDKNGNIIVKWVNGEQIEL